MVFMASVAQHNMRFKIIISDYSDYSDDCDDNYDVNDLKYINDNDDKNKNN